MTILRNRFKLLNRLREFKLKINISTMLSTEQLSHNRNKPIIIIFGCTGTGKTKLSIQLAKKYLNRAEIINADALQVS